MSEERGVIDTSWGTQESLSRERYSEIGLLKTGKRRTTFEERREYITLYKNGTYKVHIRNYTFLIF